MSFVLRAAAIGDFVSLEATLHDADSLRYRDSASGWNALHFAVEGGHFECLALLAAEFPEMTEERDSAGFSAVDYACAFNDSIALAILLQFASSALDVSRGESTVLRTHRDTATFAVLQNWRRARGLPVSPLVAKGGALHHLEGAASAATPEVIVPVASHVVQPGETIKDLCFAYATTPREMRFLNPDFIPLHRAELGAALPSGAVARVPLRVRVTDATRHITLSPGSEHGGTVVLDEHRLTERRRYNTAVDVGGHDVEDSPWRRPNSSTSTRIVEEDTNRTSTEVITANRRAKTSEGASTPATQRTSPPPPPPPNNNSNPPPPGEKRVVITTTTTTNTTTTSNTTHDQTDEREHDRTPTDSPTGDRSETAAGVATEADDSAGTDADDASTTDATTSYAGSDDEVVQATATDDVAKEDDDWQRGVQRRQEDRAARNADWARRQEELEAQRRDAEARNDEAALSRIRQQQSQESEDYLAWLKSVEDDEARLTQEHEERRAAWLREADERRIRRDEEARAYDEQRRRRNAERDSAMEEEIAKARERADNDEAAALTAELERLRAEDAKDEALRTELRRSQDAEFQRRLADSERRRALEQECREKAAQSRMELQRAAADRDDARFRAQLKSAEAEEEAHRVQVEKLREEEKRKSALHDRRVEQLNQDRRRMDDAARARERREAAESTERRQRRDAELRTALEDARKSGDRLREYDIAEHQRTLELVEQARRKRQQQEEALRSRRGRALGFDDETESKEANRRRLIAESRKQAIEDERAALQREHDGAVAAESDARRAAQEREREALKLHEQRLEEARRRGDRRRELELLAEQEAAARRRAEADRAEREADAKRQREFEFAMSAVQRSTVKEDTEDKLLRAEKREVKRMKRRLHEQRRQQEARELHEAEQQRLMADARERGDRLESERLKREMDRERREAEAQRLRDEEAEWERQARFEATMTRRRQRQEATRGADEASSRRAENSELAAERQFLRDEDEARRRQAARTRQHNDEQLRHRKKIELEDAARQERDAQRKRLLFAARMSHDEEQEQRLLEEERLDREAAAKREAELEAEERQRRELMQQDMRRLELEASVAEEKRKDAERRRRHARDEQKSDASSSKGAIVRKQRAAERAEVRNARLEAEAAALAEARKEDEEAAARRRAKQQKAAETDEEAKAAAEEARRKDIEARKKKAIEDAQKRIQARRAKEKQERAVEQEKAKQLAEARAAQKTTSQREEDLSKRLQQMRENAKSETVNRSRTPSSPSVSASRSRTADRAQRASSASRRERLLHAAEEGRNLRHLERERELQRRDRLVSGRTEEYQLVKQRQDRERDAKADERFLDIRRREEEDALERAQRRDAISARLEADAAERRIEQQTALEAEERQRQERRAAAEAALSAARQRREAMLTSPLTSSSSSNTTSKSVRQTTATLPPQPTWEEQRRAQMELRRRRMNYGVDTRTRSLVSTGRVDGALSSFSWHDYAETDIVDFAPLPFHVVSSDPPLLAAGGDESGAGEEPTLVMASLRGAFTPQRNAPPSLLASPSSAVVGGRSTPPPPPSQATPSSSLQSKPSFSRRSGSMVRTSSFAAPPASLPKAAPVSPSRPTTTPSSRPLETPRNLFDTSAISRNTQPTPARSAWSGPALRFLIVVGEIADEVALTAVASKVKLLVSLLLATEMCDVQLFGGPRSAALLAPHECTRITRAGVLACAEEMRAYQGPAITLLASDTTAAAPASSDHAADTHLALMPDQIVATSEVVHLVGSETVTEWPRLVLVDALSDDAAGAFDRAFFGGEAATSVVALARLHHVAASGGVVGMPLPLCTEVFLRYTVFALSAPTAAASVCVRDLLRFASSTPELASSTPLHVSRGTLSSTTDLVPLITVDRDASMAPQLRAVLVGWRGIVARCRIDLNAATTRLDRLKGRLPRTSELPSCFADWHLHVASGLPQWLDRVEARRGVQWETSVEVLVSPTATFEAAALREVWNRCAQQTLGWGNTNNRSSHVLLSHRVIDSRLAEGHYNSLRLVTHLLLQHNDDDDNVNDTSSDPASWRQGGRVETLLQRCLDDADSLRAALRLALQPPVVIQAAVHVPWILLPPSPLSDDAPSALQQCTEALRTALLPVIGAGPAVIASCDVV